MKRKNIIIITIALIIIAALLYGLNVYLTQKKSAEERGEVFGFREFFNIGSLNIFGNQNGDLGNDFDTIDPNLNTNDKNNNGINDFQEDLNGNGILDGLEDLNGNGILDQFEKPGSSGYITRPIGRPILIGDDSINSDSNIDWDNFNLCGITNFSSNGSITVILNSPATINLSWSTENCDSVSISGISDNLPSSGNTAIDISSSQVISLSTFPNGPTAYISIVLIGDSGFDSGVTIIPDPARCRITDVSINNRSSSVTVTKGSNVNISWSSTDCEYVTITGFPNNYPSQGSVSKNVDETTNFTITGYPNGNQVSIYAFIDQFWSNIPEGNDLDFNSIEGCRVDDINIAFTATEVERLKELQRLYDSIAGRLYNQQNFEIEKTNFLDAQLEKMTLSELRNFCAQNVHKLSDPAFSRRVPTPFWNASSSNGFGSEVETFTNIPVVNSERHVSSPEYGPDNPESKSLVTLFERMLRINIW